MASEKVTAALDQLLDGLEPHQVHQLLEQRRVRRAAAREMELRPEVKFEAAAGEHAECRRHALRAFDASVDAVNADTICLDILEAYAVGTRADQYFHLVRLFRSVIAQIPHLHKEWTAAQQSVGGGAA